MSNAYMIVRYSRYFIPGHEDSTAVKASGRRINTCLNHEDANNKFKGLYNEINSNSKFTIIKKDLRKGFIIYKTSGCKMMLALMPYSNQEIKDIVI